MRSGSSAKPSPQKPALSYQALGNTGPKLMHFDTLAGLGLLVKNFTGLSDFRKCSVFEGNYLSFRVPFGTLPDQFLTV